MPASLDRVLAALSTPDHPAKKQGKEWIVPCPAHDDGKRPNLYVAQGDKGVVFRCMVGCSQESVLAAVNSRCGTHTGDLFHESNGNGHVPAAPVTITSQREWKIHDPSGTLVATHIRLNKSDGSKSFVWERNGKRNLGGLPTADLPLYNCENLPFAPNRPVVVTEGEKSCDALTTRGILAVGTVTGASNCPSAAALECLRGFDVLLWPDHDEAGFKHMIEVNAALQGIAKSIRVVHWAKAPPKGDAADFTGTDDELTEILSATPPPPEAAATVSEPEWEAPLPFDTRTVPEFPTEALSPWMGRWVEAESVAVQVPYALPGCVALGVAAIALARANVRIDSGGWTEPTNLYLAVAMDSGNRKSPVFRAAQQPLLDREKAIMAQHGAQIARINATRAAVAARLKNVEAKYARDAADVTMEDVHAASDELEATPIATLPRLITGDVTSERLGSMLAENGGAIGVMSPEGGVFDTIAGRYSNGIGNLDPWLHGHAGDAIRVDRGSRPPVIVDNPRVTIALTFQIEVLSALARKEGFAGRGLLARFGFACPTSTIGRRAIDPTPVATEITENYADRVREMLDIAPDTLDGSEAKPILVQLDAGAQARFRELRADVEPRLATYGDLAGMRSWASKYPGLVLRLAANLHVGDNPALFGRSVTASTIDRAIALGEFFLAHARSAFDVMGENPVTENAKIILAWLRDKHIGEVASLREINQGVKDHAALTRVEDLDAPVRALVNMGWLRPTPTPKGKSPGRPKSPTFDLHPAVHQKAG